MTKQLMFGETVKKKTIMGKPGYWIVGDPEDKEQELLDNLPTMEKLWGKLVAIRIDHHTGKRIYEFKNAAFRFTISPHAGEVYRMDFTGYFDPATMKVIFTNYHRPLYY